MSANHNQTALTDTLVFLLVVAPWLALFARDMKKGIKKTTRSLEELIASPEFMALPKASAVFSAKNIAMFGASVAVSGFASISIAAIAYAKERREFGTEPIEAALPYLQAVFYGALALGAVSGLSPEDVVHPRRAIEQSVTAFKDKLHRLSEQATDFAYALTGNLG